MPNNLTFDCPQVNGQVPAVFSVSGTYNWINANNSVRCTLTYSDANAMPQTQTITCVVDESVVPSLWCGRFNMTGALPAANGSLTLSATLYDAGGAPVAGPVFFFVTYNAAAADPCSCSSWPG